jgi:excisionase family DNA binding protein
VTVTLTVPEAAHVLGLSERTVWRRVRTGALPIERVGRRLLVCLPDDLSPASGPHPRTAVGGAPAGEMAPSILESEPGPWPYTAERLAERRAILLRQRASAGKVLDGIASANVTEGTAPPLGWFRRFVRDVKDEHRTWDAFMDYQRRAGEP